MQGRWWDSEAALDALDLVDGSDPAMGVSVAVLGYHAIAKQAIAPLGAQTLVDVSHLERAFETADFTEVTEAVHAATCEALGHEAACRYAQAAVADWTQRSKAAAGRLTRVLVNKGLPWPTAVQRAAEVAGVPLERLGRYATVAADRQVGDLGLVDAADRVLMEYAHYRGGMESDLVAKSGGRVRHRMQERQWDESEVNRDEAGRFAVEAHAATDEEQAERAKRREARRRRRARRTARNTRAAEAQQATQRERVAESGQQRSRVAESGQQRAAVRQRVDQRAVARQSEEPTGVLGLPLLIGVDVPEQSEWVTVDHQTVVVQYGFSDDRRESEYLPRAYSNEDGRLDVVGLLNEIAAYHAPPVAWVKGHLVGAGKLIVTGRHEADEWAGKYNKYPGWAPTYDWVMPDPDESGLELVEHHKPRRSWSADGARVDQDGKPVRVPVIVTESETVDIRPSSSFKEAFLADRLLFNKSGGRVRYRTMNKEPWDESQVKRDEAGRFAVEDQRVDEAEAAARAKRREARRARRDRRNQRNAAALAARASLEQASRQRVEQTGAQRQKVEVAGQQRTPARQKAAQRSAQRQQVGSSEAVSKWLKPCMPNPQLISTQPSILMDAGLSAAVYDKPVMLANMVRDAQLMYADHEPVSANVELIREEYFTPGNEESDFDALTLAAFHTFLADASNGSAMGDWDLEQASEELSTRVGDELQRHGEFTLQRILHSPSTQMLDPFELDGDGNVAVERAYQDQGYLAPGNYAIFLSNEAQAADQRMQVFTDTRPTQDRAFVVSSKQHEELLRLLYDLTSPRNSINGRAAWKEARNTLIQAARDNDDHVPERITTVQLLLSALSDSGLCIEAMPVDMKAQIGHEALSHDSTRPVRLDGMDVFRIY